MKIIVTEASKHFLDRSEAYNGPAHAEFASLDPPIPVLGDADEWEAWDAVGDPVLHIQVLFLSPSTVAVICNANLSCFFFCVCFCCFACFFFAFVVVVLLLFFVFKLCAVRFVRFNCFVPGISIHLRYDVHVFPCKSLISEYFSSDNTGGGVNM